MDHQNPISTFYIATYGCQMNLADSSTLCSILATRGYTRVETEEEADLLILNTCSVRDKAEQRVVGRLWDMARHKQARPKVKIAVIGCMAQRRDEELRQEIPHVDFVLGTDRLFDLPELLEGREGGSAVMTAFGHENLDVIEPAKESPFTAFVTISRGCNNFCRYCIVPYVRGRERAHSPEQIVGSIQRLVDDGVIEITLLGQNVNSYRHGKTGFPGLLELILQRTTVPRLRFMTSHPKDLSPQLVEVMASSDRIMPHIHLPLQSGSDRILAAMGRQYDMARYLGIVERIREALEYVSLTTDLMVGYPTETVAEYGQTLAAVEQVRFDAAFMFRYSVRPGTAAAREVDDVPEEEKIARLSRLIDLQQEIALDRNQRERNQVRQSLTEGFSRRSKELLRARTEGNKTVLFPGEGVRPGVVVPVRIVSADAFTLHGELAKAG